MNDTLIEILRPNQSFSYRWFRIKELLREIRKVLFSPFHNHKFTDFCIKHKKGIGHFYFVYKAIFWAYIFACLIRIYQLGKLHESEVVMVGCIWTGLFLLWGWAKLSLFWRDYKEKRNAKFYKILLQVYTQEDGQSWRLRHPDSLTEPYKTETLNRGAQNIELLVEDVGTTIKNNKYLAIVKNNGERDYSNRNTFNPFHVEDSLILTQTPMKYVWWKNKLVPSNIAYKFGVSKLSNLKNKV